MNLPPNPLQFAEDQLGRGQVEQAIETLAEYLGEAPEDADAHALLALCLIRRKRLYAAGLEAATALRLAPDRAFPHLAAASVASARGRYSEAKNHFLEAAAIDPDSALTERELARLNLYWRKLDEALSHVERALRLESENPDGLSLLGQIRLARGEPQLAIEAAQSALEADPEHIDSIVLLGDCELRNGNVAAAHNHAVWALQLDPNDEAARNLLCGIKARGSLLLGLWWRFQTFVASGTEVRSIAILLTMYLFYRTSTILLADQGQTTLSNALPYVWLAFCVYTWVAPGLFRRALEKEMGQVRLRPEF